MKTKILFLTVIGLLCFFCKITNAQIPNWSWAKNAGGTDQDYIDGVTTDPFGNSYITGTYNSATLTFGSTTLTNAGGYDLFIAKYNLSGNLIWAKNIGGTGWESGNDITSDAEGNIYITGSFQSPTLSFDTITLVNSGTSNFFIVKYNSSGNAVWARSANSGEGTSIATDTLGNVYLAGDFVDPTITIGSITLTNADPSYSTDIIIVKYDFVGNVKWAKSATGESFDYVYGLDADKSGNTYVTGIYYSPTLLFSGTTINNAGNGNIFIAKYNTAGNLVWVKSAGGTGTDYGHDIVADKQGNIFLTGKFSSLSLTFGSTTLTNAGQDDIFVTEYSPSGSPVWAKSAGGIDVDDATGIVTDKSSNIYITGNFNSSSLTFGSTNLINAGSNDIYIVKFDLSGNAIWAKCVGGSSDEIGSHIAKDCYDNIIIAGGFSSSSVAFGTYNVTNAGNSDIFIAKLGSNVGINEYLPNTFFSVYPNPASDKIEIKTQFKSVVEIYNIQGQLLIQQCILQEKRELDLSCLAKGVYILRLCGNDKTEVTRIVKE